MKRIQLYTLLSVLACAVNMWSATAYVSDYPELSDTFFDYSMGNTSNKLKSLLPIRGNRADAGDFDGSGTEADPYLISSADMWNFLADRVNAGTDYSGTFFRQTEDISVSTMVGSGSGETPTHPFSGTYDGNGHTLTFTISATEDFAAPFRYIVGAAIKNLVIDGINSSSARYNAGLVAFSDGDVAITNCAVRAAIINNVGETQVSYGNSACGGFHGLIQAGSVTFNGCLFAGQITGSAHSIGGFVGWGNEQPDGVVFNDCLFAPSELTADDYEGQTFYRGGEDNLVFHNSYYQTPFGAWQAKQAYSIMAGEGVTVANAGAVTTYNVSGLTSYGAGLAYDGVLFAGDGDVVSLNLNGSPTGGYAASGGTLTGSSNPYALMMNATDVMIVASSTPNINRLYCQVTQDWWTQSDAAVGAYLYRDESTHNADWPGERMTPVDGENGLWYIDVDASVYSNVIFTRVNGSDAVTDWGAKTVDLTIPTDSTNLYTITSTEAVWGDPGVTGEWSKYGSTAVEPDDPQQETPKFYITGDSALVVNAGLTSDKAWSPSAIAVTEDSYTFTQLPAGTYTMKVTTDGTWNTAKGYTDLTTVSDGLSKDTDGNITFTLTNPTDVTVTYTVDVFKVEGTFSGGGGTQSDRLADGYYLVGTHNNWSPTAADLFTANAEVADEYILNTTLTLGNDLKVVQVIGNENSRWFPDGDNIVVDAPHAGAVTIYFRPTYNPEWSDVGGYMYIVANATDPQDEIYSLLGTSALFGNDWDYSDTLTELTLQGESMYTYTIDSVALQTGVDYEYKVVTNHAVNVREWPSIEGGDNYHLTVEESGVYQVLFSFDPNSGCSHAANYLHAIVEPTVINLTCAEAAAAAMTVSANNEAYNNGATYSVYGYITAITTDYSSQYNNITFWMADDQAGGKVFEAYRCVLTNPDNIPTVGDFVKVTGQLTKYNTTPETVAGATCDLIDPSTLCTPITGTCGAQGDNVTWSLSCDSVMTISGTGAMASYNTNSNGQVPWAEYGPRIRDIVIEEGVTSLSAYGFYNAGSYTNGAYDNVRSLTIPYTVSKVVNNNFYKCPIETITINSDSIVGQGGFSSGSTLQGIFGAQVRQYIIGDSVRSIANSAFYNQGADSLTTIVLPEGLQSIGTWAFGYLEQMTSIVIPNTVLTIGSDAFAGCNHLRSVHLGASLTSIGAQAFWKDTMITRVTCEALTPPTLGVQAFDVFDTLFVRCESRQLYKEADNWKNFSKFKCLDGGDELDEWAFPLGKNWTFVMLPTAFGMSAEDITADGTIAWATYNCEKRAQGNSGWENIDAAAVPTGRQALLVRATDDTATLRINVPVRAQSMDTVYVPLSLHPAKHAENANWCFVGNPYPYGYLLSGLAAQGITSPIFVWNGTGYEFFTPGIDDFIIPAFGAFFIQLPEGTADAPTIIFTSAYIMM